MHKNTTLLSPFRFCWFLTIRWPYFLTSSVKIVISFINYYFHLQTWSTSPPQTTRLPHPQRYRTIFTEAVCRSPGSTPLFPVLMALWKSAVPGRSAETRGGTNTKGYQGGGWQPVHSFQCNYGEMSPSLCETQTASWLLNNILDSCCCRQCCFLNLQTKGARESSKW